jgi:hypothetical protein
MLNKEPKQVQIDILHIGVGEKVGYEYIKAYESCFRCRTLTPSGSFWADTEKYRLIHLSFRSKMPFTPNKNSGRYI